MSSLWGYGSVRRRSKTRATLPLGCHCGSQNGFSGCLLQWLMSYFIFPLDYQERMEHGRGASQPLNLFLFLESADLSPQSPHLFDALNTTFFPAHFYQTLISTQRYWDIIEAWVFCSLALWPVQEQTRTISLLETRAICFNPKGAEMRESRHIWLAIVREVRIQCKAHGGMRESERWKTKRARGEETTGWES